MKGKDWTEKKHCNHGVSKYLCLQLIVISFCRLCELDRQHRHDGKILRTLTGGANLANGFGIWTFGRTRSDSLLRPKQSEIWTKVWKEESQSDSRINLGNPWARTGRTKPEDKTHFTFRLLSNKPCTMASLFYVNHRSNTLILQRQIFVWIGIWNSKSRGLVSGCVRAALSEGW